MKSVNQVNEEIIIGLNRVEAKIRWVSCEPSSTITAPKNSFIKKSSSLESINNYVDEPEQKEDETECDRNSSLSRSLDVIRLPNNFLLKKKMQEIPSPRPLFNKYWSKQLPERINSFEDVPFPLRETLFREESESSDENDVPFRSPVPKDFFSLREEFQRSIFGSAPYGRHSLICNNSDSMLETYPKPEYSFRKTVSASVLMKNRKKRGCKVNVKFSPHVDVIEFAKDMEVYAHDDWSKFFS